MAVSLVVSWLLMTTFDRKVVSLKVWILVLDTRLKSHTNLRILWKIVAKYLTFGYFPFYEQ